MWFISKMTGPMTPKDGLKPGCSCPQSSWPSSHSQPHCPSQDPVTIIFTANPHPCTERQWALWSCLFCSGVISGFFLYLVSSCLPGLCWCFGLALNEAFESASGLYFCRWDIPSAPLFPAKNSNPPMQVKKRSMTGEAGWIPTETMKNWNNNRDFQSDLALCSTCLETWVRRKEKLLPKLQSQCYVLSSSRELLWRLPLGSWLLSLFEMEKKRSQVPGVTKSWQSNFFSCSELLFSRKRSQQLERQNRRFMQWFKNKTLHFILLKC